MRKIAAFTIFSLVMFVAGSMLLAQEDPFGDVGSDELGIADGSSSLRFKRAPSPTELKAEVVQIKKKDFPLCIFTAKIIETAKNKKLQPHDLIEKGKTYLFKPLMTMVDGRPDIKDASTRYNLCACYLKPGDVVVVDVSGTEGKNALARKVVRE